MTISRTAGLFAASALALSLGAGFSAVPAPEGTGIAARLGAEFSMAASAQEAPEILPDRVLGDPAAPVTMIEYASFTCSHCAAFHENVFGDLKADYIDTGKVQFIQREVYFDKYGLWAGLVANCGGDDRYYAISDLILSQQSDWIANGSDEAISENLRRIGLSAGLSGEELDACMSDRDQAQAMVATFQHHAEADDVRGTPSFVINGTKHSNMNYDTLRGLLDAELEG